MTLHCTKGLDTGNSTMVAKGNSENPLFYASYNPIMMNYCYYCQVFFYRNLRFVLAMHAQVVAIKKTQFLVFK